MTSLLKQLYDLDGAVASSEWVTGSGRYVRAKNVPIFCSKIPVKDIHNLKGFIKKSAEKAIKFRPRVRFLIVITDLNSAKRYLKDKNLI